MMKMLATLTFIMLSTSGVFAEDIKCSISVNAEPVVAVEFSVLPGTKEMFVDSTDYRFFLTNKGNSKFELEVFDAYAPSRSYSIGYMRTLEDELSWAFWSREVLIETTCKLNQ